MKWSRGNSRLFLVFWKFCALADQNGSFDSKFETKINFSSIFESFFFVLLFCQRENKLESQNQSKMDSDNLGDEPDTRSDAEVLFNS